MVTDMASTQAAAAKVAHSQQPNPWRLCVAPMMDWTDRHCRYFHRLLSPDARLYTEMVTTGALLHGDVPRHLDFDPAEHPVALQLGGSEPADLAQAARLGQQWGYDEINLNCGCPSERVQRGAFGACLMAEPALVRDGVKAMVDAVGGAIPVTVKHRIGIDQSESYAFVRDFVGTVAQGGCSVFIVHARNAWLKGLSPRENREVPPLRYDVVRQLKRDFPALTFVLNGGLRTVHELQAAFEGDTPLDGVKGAASMPPLDGVMVGREAYHHPYQLTVWQRALFAGGVTRAGGHWQAPERDAVEAAMAAYAERMIAASAGHRHALQWPGITRHMMGLHNGMPGARLWRQVLSDHRLRHQPLAEVLAQAAAARRRSRAGEAMDELALD
jgi:tRNA-dihydrouridine synthase A